jgi:hypothetical protein
MPTAPPNCLSSFDTRGWRARGAEPSIGLAFVGLAFILALGCRRAAEPGGRSSTGAAPPVGLALTGNVMSFDGKLLRFRDRIETWTAVLGPPTYPAGSRDYWPGLQVFLSDRGPDGRQYVGGLKVRFGEGGFPGPFALQRIPIREGLPTLESIQRALANTATPLVGRGGGAKPFDAIMDAHEPDGFVVHLLAHLDCPPPPPPRPRASCAQTIDELEIWSSW